jgi:hypothetical protein
MSVAGRMISTKLPPARHLALKMGAMLGDQPE